VKGAIHREVATEVALDGMKQLRTLRRHHHPPDIPMVVDPDATVARWLRLPHPLRHRQALEVVALRQIQVSAEVRDDNWNMGKNMKTSVWCSCLLAVVLVLTWHPVYAQYPEDALRLGTPGYGVGGRALGMGNAYSGVASDYSALFWNPAGLAQMRYGEFSFGLSYLGVRDTSTFFGSQGSSKNNATNLNTLGLVFPVPTQRGSLVFAFGYSRENNFTGGVNFTGFNPNSSIIQSSAPNGGYYPDDLSGNIAYQLFLADIDTLRGTWISPITNRVNQSGVVAERGGLNNWSFGGAVDIAKDVSIGATLSYVTGSYQYERNYEESDPTNVHSVFPYDFKRLTLSEYIDDDIWGWSGKFGVMFRSSGALRFGLTAKTPTAFTVRESWTSLSRSYFDNGDVRPTKGPFDASGNSEYDVHTPWVFGGGVSLSLGILLLSGDADYTDWTQLEFAHANDEILAWNREMSKIFRDTWNARAGAELEIPSTPIRLRGGFIYNSSPYKDDPASFDQKFITGGLGILFGGSTMIDFAYARGWWETYRVNYDQSSKVNEQVTTNTFFGTLSYRF
jgi:hypothetical protein